MRMCRDIFTKPARSLAAVAAVAAVVPPHQPHQQQSSLEQRNPPPSSVHVQFLPATIHHRGRKNQTEILLNLTARPFCQRRVDHFHHELQSLELLLQLQRRETLTPSRIKITFLPFLIAFLPYLIAFFAFSNRFFLPFLIAFFALKNLSLMPPLSRITPRLTPLRWQWPLCHSFSISPLPSIPRPCPVCPLYHNWTTVMDPLDRKMSLILVGGGQSWLSSYSPLYIFIWTVLLGAWATPLFKHRILRSTPSHR